MLLEDSETEEELSATNEDMLEKLFDDKEISSLKNFNLKSPIMNSMPNF